MIDSNDRDRYDEAKQELEQVIQQACSDDRSLPILVLANKQDMPNASSAVVLESMLQLESLRQHCAALSIHPTVATAGVGVKEGMEWLIDTISNRMRARNVPPSSSSSSKAATSAAATTTTSSLSPSTSDLSQSS